MSRLVITQKPGDKVTVRTEQEEIATITVSKIDRNQVRLAFEADPKVKIIRQPKQKNSV